MHNFNSSSPERTSNLVINSSVNELTLTEYFKDIKETIQHAKEKQHRQQSTLLFIDEIHRFNRAQQDAFLPYVEDGTVILVGATTENPSFELIPALLSRCHVFVLHRLDNLALEKILEACELLTERGLPLTDEARISLKAMADGDGRFLLNLVEALLEFLNLKILFSKFFNIRSLK